MAKNQKERKLDSKLIEVYNTRGFDVFLQVCASMLNIRDNEDYKKKMKVNGEVCEVLLRVTTEHYLRTNHIKGSVFHSLVLPNKLHPERDFRTELDFTCVTPYVCIVGECKSFVGDVVASQVCTLTRQSKRYGTLTADVARQTQIHVDTIAPYLKDYVLSGAGCTTPPMMAFCFMFSNGTLEDCREKAAQSTLPILTVHDLFRYYDLVFKKYRREVYNVKAASKTFQAMADSGVLHIQHANYLGY